MTLTIICPAALCDKANQLALVLGQSMADGDTFDARDWPGIDAGPMALACIADGAAWLAVRDQLPDRPDWDIAAQIDMDAAETARASLTDWSGDGAMPSDEETILLVTQVDPLTLVRSFAAQAGD